MVDKTIIDGAIVEFFSDEMRLDILGIKVKRIKGPPGEAGRKADNHKSYNAGEQQPLDANVDQANTYKVHFGI